jgi:hypothetical protein
LKSIVRLYNEGMHVDKLRVGIFCVGCLGWDEDLELKIKEGEIDEATLEEAISKLFVKTEEFIIQMSDPMGFGPVTEPNVNIPRSPKTVVTSQSNA